MEELRSERTWLHPKVVEISYGKTALSRASAQGLGGCPLCRTHDSPQMSIIACCAREISASPSACGCKVDVFQSSVMALGR